MDIFIYFLSTGIVDTSVMSREITAESVKYGYFWSRHMQCVDLAKLLRADRFCALVVKEIIYNRLAELLNEVQVEAALCRMDGDDDKHML